VIGEVHFRQLGRGTLLPNASLARDRARKRQTHVLTPPAEAAEEERPSAEVIDLMAVLQKSLKSRGGARGRRKAA